MSLTAFQIVDKVNKCNSTAPSFPKKFPRLNYYSSSAEEIKNNVITSIDELLLLGIKVYPALSGYDVFGMLNNWHFERYPEYWLGTGPRVQGSGYENIVKFQSPDEMYNFLKLLKSTTFKLGN